MQGSKTSVLKNETPKQLAEVLTAIGDVQTMESFLRDVMTEKEIIEISSRLEAAKMLKAGKKYTEVTERAKLSSRTVARISTWMQNGCGGYETALKIIEDHQGHISPARAE
jgi:TrpR-related protein YerC/YecD